MQKTNIKKSHETGPLTRSQKEVVESVACRVRAQLPVTTYPNATEQYVEACQVFLIFTPFSFHLKMTISKHHLENDKDRNWEWSCHLAENVDKIHVSEMAKK